MRWLLAAVAVAMAAVDPTASAAPLLARSTRPDAGEPGVRARTLLTLDRGALASLRTHATLRLDGVPVGRGETVAVDLRRVDPLAHTRIEEVGPRGRRALPHPTSVYFTGTVAGRPDSRVLLVAGRRRVRGFVVAGEIAAVFGPDGAGQYRAIDLRDVDPAVYPGPGDFCHASEATVAPGAPAPSLANPVLPPAAPVGATLLQVDVAIDTDNELRAKFASAADAVDYVASLVAAADFIYERDLALRLHVSYLRFWTAPDPWTTGSTEQALYELGDYWTDPANDMDAIAGPRAIVHLLSGKTVTGGIAWLNAACDPDYGYGVSQVYGGFDLASPNQIWDVVVFTHEVGHNVGTHHTHCYEPPLDRCYNQEPGCYSGPVVASRGTIMSYCHTLPGGLANIDLDFPPIIQTTIRSFVETRACLAPVGPLTCGDGIVDEGEGCDDGNTIGGDGCSASCQIEACGNGITDVGEECDDGGTTPGDGCSATCRTEACGNGVVDVGEGCDDGNTTPGDGCAADCTLERCPILSPHQEAWRSAIFTIVPHGPGRDRLALKAAFGVPDDALLDPATRGLALHLEDASAQPLLEVTLPGGPAWRTRPTKAIYRDPAGAQAGLRKATVRWRKNAGYTTVKVSLSGEGGAYPTTLDAMPRAIVLLLGDGAAVASGACGEKHFTGIACRSVQRGRKLVCK